MSILRPAFMALALVFATPADAVQPDEILADPVLEQRARDISAGLRCLVCRNESIDASNADLARDMRLLVRERLVAGDSNEQAVNFIVERYGEYVLLRPTTDGTNMLLWVAAPTLFLIAMGSSIIYLRRRAQAPELSSAGLDADEERRLQELMKE